MVVSNTNLRVVSSNVLKIIAALSMVADHIGYLLFPEVKILRIIGRIAFPIFAFMIAQGCKHTRNKKKYFFTVSGLALACQLVYYFFADSLYMCILVTFSLSILMIYSLQNFKSMLFSSECSIYKKCFGALGFALPVVAVYLLNNVINIDYGFWGCMIPVFASIFQFDDAETPDSLKNLDRNFVHVIAMGIGLVILAFALGGIQYYSLAALPLLMCYSGKRGKRKMKCFFYIFYPVHLTILQGFYILIK